MSDEQIGKAKRSARVIYALIGANVVVLLLLWLVFGVVQSTPSEGVADAIGSFWLLLFVSIPILSVVWFIRFGSLASAKNELHVTWWIILGLIAIWIALVVAFLILLAVIVRDLIGFL